LTLGGASKVWRALFDFITPLAVGGMFFLSLNLSAGGVFRFYALFAFAAGGGCFYLLYRKIRPLLSAVLKRIIVPIKSLENAANERLRPLREKRERKRTKRRLRREEKRNLRIEEKAKKQLEKKKRKAIKKGREKHVAPK